jgi:hypothetical protein
MVTVPTLPGLITAGKTMEAALANARQAIQLHIESLEKDGEAVPVEVEAPGRRPAVACRRCGSGAGSWLLHEQVLPSGTGVGGRDCPPDADPLLEPACLARLDAVSLPPAPIRMGGLVRRGGEGRASGAVASR